MIDFLHGVLSWALPFVLLITPVFFFQGTADDVTPTALVKGYFRKIRSPHKELVLLRGGHLAVMAFPQRFLGELRRRVRGLAPS